MAEAKEGARRHDPLLKLSHGVSRSDLGLRRSQRAWSRVPRIVGDGALVGVDLGPRLRVLSMRGGGEEDESTGDPEDYGAEVQEALRGWTVEEEEEVQRMLKLRDARPPRPKTPTKDAGSLGTQTPTPPLPPAATFTSAGAGGDGGVQFNDDVRAAVEEARARGACLLVWMPGEDETTRRMAMEVWKDGGVAIAATYTRPLRLQDNTLSSRHTLANLSSQFRMSRSVSLHVESFPPSLPPASLRPPPSLCHPLTSPSPLPPPSPLHPLPSPLSPHSLLAFAAWSVCPLVSSLTLPSLPGSKRRTAYLRTFLRYSSSGRQESSQEGGRAGRRPSRCEKFRNVPLAQEEVAHLFAKC